MDVLQKNLSINHKVLTQHKDRQQPFACRTQNMNYYFDTIQQAKAVDDDESFDDVCKNPI